MLGKIDFANAPSFEAVPAADYEGQTVSWEAKPSKDQKSTNIEAKFVFDYTDDKGNEQKRTIINRWNLKPEALWRMKRDLIAMGADPADFESTNVDLEAILNDFFGSVPTPVTLSIVQREYTPPEGGEAQTRNEIAKVVRRDV